MAASERDNRTLMAVVNCVFALRRKKNSVTSLGDILPFGLLFPLTS
jgi:hypothetical protein